MEEIFKISTFDTNFSNKFFMSQQLPENPQLATHISKLCCGMWNFFPGQKQLCNVISSSKHECIFFSHILQQKVRWMTVVDIYTFSHFAWPGAGRSRDPPPASVLPPPVWPPPLI